MRICRKWGMKSTCLWVLLGCIAINMSIYAGVFSSVCYGGASMIDSGSSYNNDSRSDRRWRWPTAPASLCPGGTVVRKTTIEVEADAKQQQAINEIYHRNSERRKRTMPPQKVGTADLDQPQLLLTMAESPREEHPSNKQIRPKLRRAGTNELCGALAKQSSENNADSFFVSQDALNKDSRVFIHGILTPIGFHLALAIEEQCGAQVATGFENTFPNTAKDMMEKQERLGILVSQLHFQRNVVNSFVGLDPFGKKPSAWPRLNLTGEIDIIKWQPTHIVNLASYSPEAYRHLEPVSWRNDWDPYSQNGHYDPKMLGIRSQMVVMEQILSAMALKGDKSRVPHFLYASSNLISQLSSPGLSIEDRWQARNAQLAEVLADTYHQTRGVYSVSMRLPNSVYGNWGHPDSDVNRIIERERNPPRILYANSSEERPWSSRHLDMVHMGDIIDAIIAAMQFRTLENRPVAFTPTANSLVPHSYVKTIVKNIIKRDKNSIESRELKNPLLREDVSGETKRLLGWTPKVELSHGLVRTLAWKMDRDNPYGSKSTSIRGDDLLQQNGLETCPLHDTVCRSSPRSLPCASECEVEAHCVATAWDPLVQELKTATLECNTVVYTQSLEETDAQLPKAGGTNPTVCYLAVLSRKGKLAQELLRSEQSGSNSNLVHQGWRLFFVDLPEKISTAEMFLFKHSPGKFFSPSVKFAMFVNAMRSFAPGIKTIQFLVAQLHQPSWVPKDDPNPKHERQPMPGPASMLVPQLVYQDKVNILPEDSSVKFNQAVNIMIRDTGRAKEIRDSKNLERYRFFIERIPTFTDRREFMRSVSEPFFPYGIHHWIGSGWVVHDLSRSHRDLRCDWYQETVQWDMQVDSLSLAHVLAKRAMDHCHRYIYPQMFYFQEKGIPFGVTTSPQILAAPEVHRACPIVFPFTPSGQWEPHELPSELQAPELLTARIFSNYTMHKARYAWERDRRNQGA